MYVILGKQLYVSRNPLPIQRRLAYLFCSAAYVKKKKTYQVIKALVFGRAALHAIRRGEGCYKWYQSGILGELENFKY